jgi:hypothetical protein
VEVPPTRKCDYLRFRFILPKNPVFARLLSVSSNGEKIRLSIN